MFEKNSYDQHTPTPHETTTFTIHGQARPQGSKTNLGRGRIIESSPHVRKWRKTVTTYAKQHFHRPYPKPTPIELHINAVLPRTKAMGKKRQDPMVQTPDIDKLLRAICDGLTGIAYEDDSQVIHCVIHKRRTFYEEEPHVRVLLRAYPDLKADTYDHP